MILKIDQFRVRHFKSILDSGIINLDPDVTILIGKNEAGKTNLLKSLEYFDRDEFYEKELLPSHLGLDAKHDISNKEYEDIIMAEFNFTVEEDDKEKLEKIHSGLKAVDSIKCSKFLDNHYRIEIPDVNLDSLISPEQVSIDLKIEENRKNIVESAKRFKEDLDNILADSIYKNNKSNFLEIIDKLINFDPQEIENINYEEELTNQINYRDPRNNYIMSEINEFINEIDGYKDVIVKNLLSLDLNIEEQILEILPNFMYFSTIDELEDEAHWDDLKNNKNRYKTLRNLIYLSDLDINIDDYTHIDNISKTENASATITGQINNYWKQDKVKIKLYITNDKVSVLVWDDYINSFQVPSLRSEGFKWFLSFYINFTAGSKEEFKNTIILLDDPGVYLHNGGQKDLINTLQKLSKSNQIILATHSPFMINKDDLGQIRIVSKKENDGTIVTEKFHESAYDALAPVRAAIGMNLGDLLFIGEKTLVAEGITDDILLKPMSKLLQGSDENFIDTSKITFLDVNGADKVKFYLPFLLKENIDYLILLDYDEKGRKKAEELKKQYGSELNILMHNEVKNRKGDFEIEDLFDYNFYLRAVNLVYKDLFIKKLGKEALEKEDINPKTFRGIKNYFRKSEKFKRLDKKKVAKKIVELIEQGELPNKNTINNFSKLFKLINEKLDN